MNYLQKSIHIITELSAVLLIVPFLISLLFKYKFKTFDKYILIIIIILTIIIDGGLLINWFIPKKETFVNDEKREIIKKLIRQSSRYSLAARGDKTPLISVLHSNYGASIMFVLKDLFTDEEINEVIGSTEERKKYEQKIIEIQDKATKNAVKHCPNYTDTIDFLTELAGQT